MINHNFNCNGNLGDMLASDTFIASYKTDKDIMVARSITQKFLGVPEDLKEFFDNLGDAYSVSFEIHGTTLFVHVRDIVMHENAFVGIFNVLQATSNNNKYTMLKSVNLLSEPVILMQLNVWLSARPVPPKPPIEGVYDIGIVERYIDLMGREREDEHTLSTLDFDNILDELYPGIDIKKMIKTFMESDETILILVGRPGTGKTSLIKKILYEAAMLSRSAQNAQYVKDARILHEPSYWAELANKRWLDFLILDDLDKELLPRELETMEDGNVKPTIVNSLLSYSNGLFPVDTKIIITTNMSDEKIDPAVLRPGRCFELLDFPHLERDHALTIWNNKFELTEDQFVQSFGEAKTVSQAHIVSEADKIKKASPKDYLIDTSISARDRYLG